MQLWYSGDDLQSLSTSVKCDPCIGENYENLMELYGESSATEEEYKKFEEFER